MDLGELGGFGDVEKTETQEGNCPRRRWKILLCTVVGGLGRSLVVAVCQNTPLESGNQTKLLNTRLLDLRNIFRPPFGRASQFGVGGVWRSLLN